MKRDWMIKESELDDDQLLVLMATLDKSCIVEGCAGSGKSVLALIKAQRIQREKGNNYKVIVFTKALYQYMSTGKKELGLQNDFYYYWQFKKRPEYQAADYIIVDEIQDFSEEEIMEFIKATKKNFFFFGDTNQSIFEGLKSTIPVDEIRYKIPIGKPVKNFELYRNYRLPKPVAKVAVKVGIDVRYVDGT
ncbi:MAG: AAA family ATPase, partial [Prevotella sp.]|nr:AAA family ATPase [Prevotella sp.]